MYLKPEFIISLQEKANRQNCKLSVTIDRSVDAPAKIILRLDANEMNAHVEAVWLERELEMALSPEDVLRREVARMIGQIQERRYKINDIRTAQQLCDRFAYNATKAAAKIAESLNKVTEQLGLKGSEVFKEDIEKLDKFDKEFHKLCEDEIAKIDRENVMDARDILQAIHDSYPRQTKQEMHDGIVDAINYLDEALSE